MSAREIPPQQGDEARLVAEHDEHLRTVLSMRTYASADNIDDACAYAWMQVLVYQPRRETFFPWLYTVAKREALRLHAVEHGRLHETAEISYDIRDLRDPIDGATELLDAKQRLADVPDRWKAALFLRGAGHSAEEIGAQLGVSGTRAQQLYERARNAIRIADRERLQESRDLRPAVKLLHELQREPPVFLKREIGRFPPSSPKNGGELRRLQWSQLAMRIVHYRSDEGISDPTRAFGREPAEDDERRLQLERDIDAYPQFRRRGRQPPQRGLD